ncbi:helix-turn-helix transcriptional regulator [Bradyrhizobium prioriisuperbiae]|uniref:helix-turn-helix domain-containing protein n=1 Tax=Bradyrhizobium prioriisuperbiae TaxID=2854389 RepID=UPI0028E5BC6B|nr:helix-turn-helix transcriptional regulator [Bradyrhizobium prioritasuperba]
MPIDYFQVGQRLRAHRVGQGLSPEEAAEKLGISRAALYNYEKGEGPVKLDTLERIADLLQTSLPSLLGVGTEYFSSALAYFERLRQIEALSDRVLVYYEPVSFLLTSDEYPKILQDMLLEGLPDKLPNRRKAQTEIEQLITILAQRKAAVTSGGPSFAGIVGATQVRRLLRTGFIGTYDLTKGEREKRRLAARKEVERIADVMENEPIGVQIGVVDDTLPNQTFEICRLRGGGALVAVSPFRLGELPNIRLGVASITGADEAIGLYQQLADQMWSRAVKGGAGAALLRKCLREPQS